MKNIHYNLEKIKLLAEHYSNEHKCTYYVIKMNTGTYEFVTESYVKSHQDGYEVIDKYEYKETLNDILNNQNSFKYNNPYLDLSFNTTSTFKKGITYKRSTPKIGRNELCTCGCGKKYKKCPNR